MNNIVFNSEFSIESRREQIINEFSKKYNFAAGASQGKFINSIVFDSELPIESRREHIINQLLKKYHFIERTSLGKSLVGRDIPMLQIGNKENSVLLAASFHGMEWLTSLLLLKFTDDLCERIINDTEYENLISRTGISIVPCVNPDGVEISLTGASAAGEYKSLVEQIGGVELWQANARGVDINHNFNAGWDDLHRREIESGVTGPNRTRFGGPFPESEPETKAITEICRKRHFKYVVAFHSQGEEIYFDYGKNTPKVSQLMADEMGRLSGYKVSKPEGLAVGGGFKDWFIEEFSRPGFTIEVGKGKNPLPIGDFNSIYNKTKNLYFFFLRFREEDLLNTH